MLECFFCKLLLCLVYSCAAVGAPQHHLQYFGVYIASQKKYSEALQQYKMMCFGVVVSCKQ